MIGNIIIALLVLNIMVIVHELGHYIAAKKNGVEVEEFSIGFGPTIYSHEWNNTKWLIKLLPLGGYNGLKGETSEKGGPGTFVDASKKARLAILFAGSAMNLITAIFFFYISLILVNWHAPIPVSIEHPVGGVIQVTDEQYPIVGSAIEGTSAASSDTSPPYYIKEIGGVEMTSVQSVIDAISASDGNTVNMLIIKGGDEKTLILEKSSEGLVGIKLYSPAIEIYYGSNAWHKLFSGFSHTINTTVLSGKMIGSIVKYSFETKNTKPLGYVFAGPVAIVAAVDDVVGNSRHVISDLASMTGLIGVSLAIFNVLPFPGADGWHIMLVLLEKIRGKKANQKLVGIISSVGIGLLLLFGIIIIIKDIFFFF